MYARPVTTALLATVALGSTAFASSARGADVDPCAVPGMRTYERPGAGGPPTEVSVGIRMVDLTDINDVSQTLTGDFAVFLGWTDPRLSPIRKHCCRMTTVMKRPRSVSRGAFVQSMDSSWDAHWAVAPRLSCWRYCGS